MLFNSRIFIFIFFPILLVIYYGLRKFNLHKLALVSLIIGSFIFYGYNHPAYLLLLIVSILFNYGAYLVMSKLEHKSIRFLVAFIGVIANLGVLFYFKYYDFFISTCNSLIHSDFALRHILLPLGISFFTFQQISFVVDVYKGDIKGYNFIEYTLFVSFFPQLVAGPIVLHDELIPQFKDETRYSIDLHRFTEGLRYFIIGLSKKTLLADSLSFIADAGFVKNMHWDLCTTLLIIFSYTFQLYFDFSGYSDMAIGLGKMLNFDLPVNFDQPFKSKNIAEFWRKWHTSLLRFMTRYVYYPLGGSRKGFIRTLINIMIVFFISGLWHGAGWTFIIWGILCGLGSIIYRIFKKIFDKLPSVPAVAINFLYSAFSFVFFRANYASMALDMFKCLKNIHFNGSIYTVCDAYAKGATNAESLFATLILFIVAFLIVFFGPSSHNMAQKKINCKFLTSGIFYGILFALCILTFANVSTFIYFNF